SSVAFCAISMSEGIYGSCGLSGTIICGGRALYGVCIWPDIDGNQEGYRAGRGARTSLLRRTLAIPFERLEIHPRLCVVRAQDQRRTIFALRVGGSPGETVRVPQVAVRAGVPRSLARARLPQRDLARVVELPLYAGECAQGEQDAGGGACNHRRRP